METDYIVNSLRKIDKREKLFLVVDTETAGGLNFPLVYDIGFTVTNKKGDIFLKDNFLVSEIWNDIDLMENCFFKNKIPLYIDMVAKNEIVVKPLKEVLQILNNIVNFFNIATLAAYNANFDTRALTNTICKVLKVFRKKEIPYIDFLNRTVFRKQMNVLCIMNFACQVVLTQTTYIRQAIRYNWFTEKGNIRTTAEHTYRYISNNSTFIEEHTALQDAIIETAILARCFKQHKKFDKTLNNGRFVVQRRYKELQVA